MEYGYGDRVSVEMVYAGRDGNTIFLRPRKHPNNANVAIAVDAEFVSPIYGSVALKALFDGIHGDILSLRKEVLDTMSADADKVNAELSVIETKLDAAKQAQTRLIGDFETLLAKLNGGESITPAELQAILDREKAIEATAQGIADAANTEAEKAEAANPPAPTQQTS